MTARKKTVYRPVISLPGGPCRVLPVHLERVSVVITGRTGRGEPVWSQYPGNQALCGAGDLVSTVAEANCETCLRQRDREQPARSPSATWQHRGYLEQLAVPAGEER